jgi:hypothetical protein
MIKACPRISLPFSIKERQCVSTFICYKFSVLCRSSPGH